jgi:hypothetical protein
MRYSLSIFSPWFRRSRVNLWWKKREGKEEGEINSIY